MPNTNTDVRPAVSSHTWVSPLVPGVTFQVMEVTPEIAEEWLLSVPERQRRKSITTYEKYATDMSEGAFSFTGDPIRFDTSDECIDGQHRLTGIVESQKAQVLLVIRGLPTRVIHNIDTGRMRSFADTLRIEGYTNPRALAAVTGRLWHWVHGNYGRPGLPRVSNAIHTGTAPSRNLLMRTLLDNEVLVTAAHQGNHLASYLPNAPASIYALSWFVLTGVDVDLREQFWHELLHGPAQNNPEYPITVLRRALTRRRGETEKMADWVWLAYIFRTWNAWLTGESISYLRMPSPVRWDTLPQPLTPAEVGLEAGALLTAPVSE